MRFSHVDSQVNLVIGTNFNNSANFNILNEINNTQNTSQNVQDVQTQEVTQSELDKQAIKESIARLDEGAKIIDRLCEIIDLENKADDLENNKKKNKMIPFIVLMEINMEIQRRKSKGINQPYYKDPVFIGEIMRSYGVDIS